MQPVIRRDTLLYEVLPLAVFLLIAVIIFFVAQRNDEDLPSAQAALAFTMHLVGVMIAVVAAFGLLWRAINGATLEGQFIFVIVLLGGLLLVDIHWSLAIVLGAIGIALIVRELFLYRMGGATGSATVPTRHESLP